YSPLSQEAAEGGIEKDREADPQPGRSPGGVDMPLKEAVRDLEIRLIREALQKTRYNQSQAARRLGLSYHQFRGLLRKYRSRIEPERFVAWGWPSDVTSIRFQPGWPPFRGENIWCIFSGNRRVLWVAGLELGFAPVVGIKDDSVEVQAQIVAYLMEKIDHLGRRLRSGLGVHSLLHQAGGLISITSKRTPPTWSDSR
ncbi:MAG: hypothetical protein JRC92_07975, partial [Deltaproteobacteria bacterium]|nr:hypothetical protein [Deltaproteobacteria bacterium]